MIKFLIGGSPCTHWSIAQCKARETEPDGIGWELFKNYLIAKKMADFATNTVINRYRSEQKKALEIAAEEKALVEMTAKKIAFAPGDEIIADIEEVISEDEQGMHIKRYIRKVHNYPKYTRVVKGVKQQTFIE